MARQVRKMPALTLIQKHWASRLVEWGKFDSVKEVMEKPMDGETKQEGYCFACGFAQSTLERAHILAKQLGGEDAVENLHCLCYWCHKDSESISGEEYWKWFHSRTVVDAAMSVTVRRAGMNAWSQFMELERHGRYEEN